MLAELEPLIGKTLAETMTGSWVTGAASQAVHLPKPPVQSFPGPQPDDRTFRPSTIKFPGFDKAYRELTAKEVFAPQDYYSMAAAAREKAFTISGDLTAKTRDKLKLLLDRTAADTADYSQFVREARQTVENLPLSDRHLQQVYRNAANELYSSGKEAALDNPIVGDGFPFAKFHAIHDGRVRADHLALEHEGFDGTNIYLRDSSVWRRIRPPLGWGCRCGWAPCSIQMAARAGVRFAIDWLDNIKGAMAAGTFTGTQADYRPPVPELPMPPVNIPPSWERTV